MADLVLLFVLLLGVAVWLSFTYGRATADRKSNLNHHHMMMLLVDLRSSDDMSPIMPASRRARLERLLGEYEHLDLDEG